jgi:ribosome-binding factor A
MKLPSLNTLIKNAAATFYRFPLSILIALTGCIAATILIENDFKQNPFVLKLLYTTMLGLPLTVGAVLYAERRGSRTIMAGVHVASLLLLAGYMYFLAPDTYAEQFQPFLVFSILHIAAHLWVAVAPYIGFGERTGFWRFNEMLFSRMVLSAIFSAVLFGGLCLALFAMNNLLKIEVRDERYGELWVYIAGLFNTWFFLAGVPADYKEINTEKTFPKALKIFTQYILIPLSTIYMLILYAYGLKILFQWNLPKGWVSTLIMWYSLVSILALLLVNPLKDDTANGWVRLFMRFFFIALLPLLILLFVAVGVRIGQYGVTELRYYVLLLGCWLAAMAIYFIFSRQKNIKIIPVSLMITSLLTLFGPWGVFSVSNRSQLNRLEKLLVKNEMWSEGGKIKEPKKEVAKKDRQEIQGIIEYIVEHNRVSSLQHIYDVDLEKLEKSVYPTDTLEANAYVSRYNRKSKMEDTLIAMLHVKQVDKRWYLNSYYYTEEDKIDIQGYSKLYLYNHISNNKEEEIIILPGNDTLKVMFRNNRHEQNLTIEWGAFKKSVMHLEPILKRIEKLPESASVPVSYMTVYAEGDSSSKLVIKNMDVNNNTDEDSKKIERLEGYLMVK